MRFRFASALQHAATVAYVTLLLAACGSSGVSSGGEGGDSKDGGHDDGPGQGSSSDGDAPSGGAANSDDGGSGGKASGDGGSGGSGQTGGAGGEPAEVCVPGEALPVQCDGGGQLTGCLENASGCPGDVVEMDVFIEARKVCPEFIQGTMFFELPKGWKLLEPIEDDSQPTGGHCLRSQVCETCETRGIDFAVLPGSAVGQAACPEVYPIGKYHTLKIEIPDDAAPGDYPLDPVSKTSIDLLGTEQFCGDEEVVEGVWQSREFIAPTVRVF